MIRRGFQNVGAEALVGLGEVMGVDALGAVGTYAAVAGGLSVVLPLVGVGLLAYELINLIWYLY